MEIWKSVYGYDGLYIVSNTGRIKSVARIVERSRNGVLPVKERELSQCVDRYGYKYVSLQKDGKRKPRTVHRIVLESFDYRGGLQVNHKDGNKLNNNLLNLEWVTLKENIQHAQRMGLRQHYKRGVIKIENGIATHYASVKDAINANGTRPKQMNHWLKGNPTRKGIIYKYENYRKDYGQEIK